MVEARLNGRAPVTVPDDMSCDDLTSNLSKSNRISSNLGIHSDSRTKGRSTILPSRSSTHVMSQSHSAVTQSVIWWQRTSNPKFRELAADAPMGSLHVAARLNNIVGFDESGPITAAIAALVGDGHSEAGCHKRGQPKLLKPIDTYLQAINAGDAAALQSSFADHGVVKDVGREFRGIAAIKEWASQEIFAVNFVLDVIDA
jgi:hypothetical protein